MEKKFFISQNGQSVVQDDFNTIGEYALADDRLLAEFLRLAPFDGSTVAKAIFPYSADHDINSVVKSSGATDNSVVVSPFRAFVGSRTAEASDALKNWRDIRSGIWVGDATSLDATVALNPNPDANPRWTIVYAQVTLDSNSPGVIRKVKDPASKVITPTTVTTTKVNSVSIATFDGNTTSPSPAVPALPSDSGGTYNIPLAYVFVPAGWSSGEQVDFPNIQIVAPVRPINRVVGASSVRVASKQTNVDFTKFGNLSRPTHFLPSDCIGSEKLIVVLDLLSGSSANWSHTNVNNVVDDSRDWQGRLWTWMVWGATSSGTEFAFQYNAGPTHVIVPSVGANTVQVYGSGQSIVPDGNTTYVSGGVTGKPTVCLLDQASNFPSGLGAATKVALYCDPADGGKLKVQITGTPTTKLFIILEAFGPISNVMV